jgi:precorrin-6B methylase 2
MMGQAGECLALVHKENHVVQTCRTPEEASNAQAELHALGMTTSIRQAKWKKITENMSRIELDPA